MVDSKLKEILREVVSEGVTDALVQLGIDRRNPYETQKDMAFLRETRERCTSIKNKAVAVTVGVFVTTGLGALGAGIVVIAKGNGL